MFLKGVVVQTREGENQSYKEALDLVSMQRGRRDI